MKNVQNQIISANTPKSKKKENLNASLVFNVY